MRAHARSGKVAAKEVLPPMPATTRHDGDPPDPQPDPGAHPLSALELKVPPLALTALALVPILAAGQWLQIAELPFPGHRVVSIAALVIGITILFGAALQFRLQHTTLDPRVPAKASEFVAKGLYRFSRNPMYLGMALVLFGVAAWRSNGVGYLVVVIFCAYLTELQIKPEERALEGVFGGAYAAYMARVRRWL